MAVEVGVEVLVKVAVLVGVGVAVLQMIVMETVLLVTGPPPDQVALP